LVYYLKHGDGPVFFEFDEAKSNANQRKHGIDFIEAQQLWADEKRVQLPARSLREERFVIVGLIEGRHWSAIVTRRGTTLRIISVRRARREEVAKYGDRR
jgi:uncharacterized DUF497 family protein